MLYTEGAPRKKQYHCFFREAPKISRKIDIYTCTRIRIMNKITRSFISMEKLTTQDLKTL